MGNHNTSRKTPPKQKSISCDTSTCVSKQTNNDQQGIQQRIDTHYNTMDNVLHQHLYILHINPNIPELTKSIHENSIRIAMKHHLNATSLQAPHYFQFEQMMYKF